MTYESPWSLAKGFRLCANETVQILSHRLYALYQGRGTPDPTRFRHIFLCFLDQRSPSPDSSAIQVGFLWDA
jgi:hypothetical protein